MSAELLINVTPRESRVAILENGVLQEVLIERATKLGIVGNIYKGKVNRVLPGMEAAFVDIGLEKSAFLHASDLIPSTNKLFNGFSQKKYKYSNEKKALKISDHLYEGKEILVQVIKDALGNKGARLTTHISIASRYLVLMPNNKNCGVSSKIEEEYERRRLKEIVKRQWDKIGTLKSGYIVRTAAENASENSLRHDIKFLNRIWDCVQSASAATPAGNLVYSDLPLVQRILRDMVGEKISQIKIDSRETAAKVIKFCQAYIPDLTHIIEHYPGERPIFDLHSVEDEIQKALERTVRLKSGGYLIIDQTEAMTTIDVNTGGFVGHRNLEETIFKTNLEATYAISRQLRLRNLGGIIIIDFIDMATETHKTQVLTSLEKSLSKDYAKTYVCGVSPLGLVEMTRKRTRESLEHILCEPCPTCEGRGYLKTTQTVCYEVFREILREARQFEARELLVFASQDVAELLLDEESSSLAELQTFINIPIRFQADASYTQEQYDIVLI